MNGTIISRIFFANNDTDDNVQYASQFDNSEESDHFLNEEITELEVQKAIKKLKCGKACGLDGITAEMLKAGGQDVVLFLSRMFNILFGKGIYPQDWAKAIAIQFIKKETPNMWITTGGYLYSAL